jgi:hypothetical protein
MKHNAGTDFCLNCGAPAPWLSRADLLDWLRHQVQTEADITSDTRLELRAALEKLKAMKADDEKSAGAWKRLIEVAPRVWNASKPVRDALMGEAVKKALGL